MDALKLGHTSYMMDGEVHSSGDSMQSGSWDVTEEMFRSTSPLHMKLDIGFLSGFIATSSMIAVSEIGDKTFFINAIMSMKHSRLAVFVGAMLALAIMTLISVFFGWIATVMPREVIHYISIVLFTVFGLKMLRDGYNMSPNVRSEDLREAESDISKSGEEIATEVLKIDVERAEPSNREHSPFRALFRVVLQAFTLTFLAEWGDRSQLATVVLAAREDMYGVAVGAILGHAVCTGLAVLGGRFVAQKISIRTLTIVGGFVFLVFALTALTMPPNFERRRP